jgi:predicted methyltransferase
MRSNDGDMKMNEVSDRKLQNIVRKIERGLEVDAYTAEDILYKILRCISDNSDVEEVIQSTRLPLLTIIDILKRLNEAGLTNYHVEDFNKRLEECVKEKKNILASYRVKLKTKYEYDQWKCNIDTSVKRARKLIDDNWFLNKKILFLGDEDLISIYLALAVNNIAEIHVVDVDRQLLELIEELNTKLELNIKTHNFDLRAPIPDYLRNRFDIFLTDPPFTYDGISLFLIQGFLSLKNQVGTKGYLCMLPLSLMGDICRVQQLIYNKGFYIDEIIKSFNIYPGFKEELPCIPSDLYILKRAKITTISDDDFKKVQTSIIYTAK